MWGREMRNSELYLQILFAVTQEQEISFCFLMHTWMVVFAHVLEWCCKLQKL